MGSRTPLIIRSEVVAEIKNRIAKITDIPKLQKLCKLTPWGSEIGQIIVDRWEEIAKPIALAETARCRTEEEAKRIYQCNLRPAKGESDTIYLECWKHFANKEAPGKASACQTYEDAFTLYKNAPKSSGAEHVYFTLLKSFEEKLISRWLDQCRTSEEIDVLLGKLVTHEQKEKSKKKKEYLQDKEMRRRLLLCTSINEAEKILEETRGLSETQDLALFVFERLVTEKIPEESAGCKTSEDARRLKHKYARLVNVSKKYQELYLTLLAREAENFVESLTGEDVIRSVFQKYDCSPKDSEARRIYYEKYCELLDDEDKELLPFGREISISDFSGWYMEVSGSYGEDDRHPRRMETIFMNQLLEQGLL